MPYLKIVLLTLLLASAQANLAQEVYKSTDSEGNVTFSDQPAGESEAVEIPATNVGDSVEVPPPVPEPVPAAPEGELIEGLPENLEGEIEANKKRSKKRTRPRKEPRGGR